MTDYTELIHALRYCANRDRPDCSVCEYEAASSCKDILKLDAAAAIEALQAEVKRLEPKRGEWIDRYDEDDKPFFKRKYVCSACGGWNTYGKSKYCPKCGAKMMEVQE